MSDVFKVVEPARRRGLDASSLTVDAVYTPARPAEAAMSRQKGVSLL